MLECSELNIVNCYMNTIVKQKLRLKKGRYYTLKKLAIFDIDYTITKKETLMELFKYVIKNDKRNVRFLPRAIFCGSMYALKIYDERKVKEEFLKFIDGIREEELARLVRKFYDEKLKTILYEDALKMMKKLKNEGYSFQI